MNQKEANGKDPKMIVTSRKRERGGRRGRRRGIERGKMHSPGLRVDVEYIILLQIELEEATGHLRHDGFELGERNVLVVGQVEVLPRLGLLHLLASDGLRHLLLLLDNVDDVAVPKRMAVSVGAAGIEENVVSGVDALHGGGDESVLGLLQSTNTGLARLCGWANLDGTPSPGCVGMVVISIACH